MKMNRELIVSLLENRWAMLPAALGPQWGAFINSFSGIVESWPDGAPQDPEAAFGDIVELLGRYRFGQDLLRASATAHPQLRALPDPASTLARDENLRQICNRLRLLQKYSKAPTVEKVPGRGKKGSK